MRDPEDDELVVVYGQDSFGNSHWRFYIYMIGLCTELEIDDGYCVDNGDIEFFNKVYQEIETIADIYHKENKSCYASGLYWSHFHQGKHPQDIYIVGLEDKDWVAGGVP